MASYTLPMDGTLSLSDIQIAIDGEEKGASKFKDCVPVLTTTPASNSVTFEKLPAGTKPNPIILKKKGEPAPLAPKIWEGTMIVEKNATQVVAYRT